MSSLFRNNKILLLIIILLVIIPFFWLKPGEMDLGGDGARLYFYDPANLIKNFSSYYISPTGEGIAEGSFAYLPFIGMLAILKQIIESSYILITLHNVIKVTVGFLAIYAIVKELLRKVDNNPFFIELSSILAGLFYLSTPAMTENYVKAIATHNQVFLNPLMFYLLLKFSLTGKMKYMGVALITSFVFANNFGYQSAPPFFAFYPLAFLFLFLYGTFITHIAFPWKKLLLVFLLFLGLHAFHLIPEVFNLIASGSDTNTRLFSASSVKAQVGYFYGVLHIPKISFHLLSYSSTKLLGQFAIIVPLILIFGLIYNKKREKTIILTSIFFLITSFFVIGKITVIGIKFYELLFLIPGFNMFRNFYGQWQFVYYFFYSLFFGLAFFVLLDKIKSSLFSKALFIFFIAYFTISSWQFINGNLVNPFREGAKDVKTAIIMDPKYENTLNFIRSIKDDSKILVFPFTDSYVQVIHGLNNGAYVGHTTIGQLTGKKDFSGYQDMPPYSDIFWQLSKRKDYESIKKLLGLLNIHYIFYNSDTKIYDTTFPGSPYSPSYVRNYMPKDQKSYKEFIKNLSSEKIFGSGFYNVYKIDETAFLPHFYTAEKILVYKDDPKLDSYSKASAFFKRDISQRPIFIEIQACKNLFTEEFCSKNNISNPIKSDSTENNSPEIQFKKINPTKYKVKVFNATEPYMLIFSEAFHNNWQAYITSREPKKEDIISSYFDGKIQEGRHKNIFFDYNTFETLGLKPLPKSTHFMANGYANAWYIKPQYLGNRQEYELVIEMTGQRVFYISLGISVLTIVGCLLWLVRLFFFKSHN